MDLEKELNNIFPRKGKIWVSFLVEVPMELSDEREPYEQLTSMMQGTSALLYRVKDTETIYSDTIIPKLRADYVNGTGVWNRH